MSRSAYQSGGRNGAAVSSLDRGGRSYGGSASPHTTRIGPWWSRARSVSAARWAASPPPMMRTLEGTRASSARIRKGQAKRRGRLGETTLGVVRAVVALTVALLAAAGCGGGDEPAPAA